VSEQGSPTNASSGRLVWAPILRRAASVVDGYDTGVTLRQLFYRLVSEELLASRLQNALGEDCGGS